MSNTQQLLANATLESCTHQESTDGDGAKYSVTRRQFVQILGAGLVIAIADSESLAQAPQSQRRGGGRGGFAGGGPVSLAARIHLGRDGSITVLTGKVECGQGSRAELTQAAAEELFVSADRIQLIMSDTGLCPNDGTTAGSGSTPRTLPAIRQGAAAARKLLVDFACKEWGVEAGTVEVRDGKAIHAASNREWSYADLAAAEGAAKEFEQIVPQQVSVIPVAEWKVLGQSVPRPNRKSLVTGAHQFPSDIVRPGMMYGKVLRPASYVMRPPTFAARLESVDVEASKSMSGVTVVRDSDFVGVTAPTSFQASKALEALSATAKWESGEHPASAKLFEFLEQNVRGGMPANPFATDVAGAAKTLKQTYHAAYVQHAPMEPRAAVAEWDDDKLTVWTATQGPFGVRGELAQALKIPAEKIRVIVPDFGGGFGGKHSGECAIEAARLARGAGKPVSLRWTRGEEFTWAYFRPAGVMAAEASLADDGSIATWHFVNVNSGGSAVETPYKVGKSRSQAVQSTPPLRHGSYRALASTANNFARECFMDELAELAGRDPLEFRLAHLQPSRLRSVLEDVASRFHWEDRSKEKRINFGVGLACGTEKGSFVAAAAEVEVDRSRGLITVHRICETFECGKIVNPDNLLAQVQGCIVMGLGPALREEMQFADGKMQNASFSQYFPPRFDDLPEMDIHLLDRPDLPSAGAGETPIIAVAPAIANAVFQATGQRMRAMPLSIAPVIS